MSFALYVYWAHGWVWPGSLFNTYKTQSKGMQRARCIVACVLLAFWLWRSMSFCAHVARVIGSGVTTWQPARKAKLREYIFA